MPFSIPQSLQLEAKNKIYELLVAGTMQRNCSEWACPIILVKKKPDNTGKQKYRLAMNLHTEFFLSIAEIQTIIADLSPYKNLICLDFQQAYHQINLPRKLHVKLTFISVFVFYCYAKLCFGLNCAASQYQHIT